uniref:Uncharacterized protein n=1 Tax=Rhipicephalus zambeziensis TaxID=60191 RepID=A0A224YAV7_9ACAR
MPSETLNRDKVFSQRLFSKRIIKLHVSSILKPGRVMRPSLRMSCIMPLIHIMHTPCTLQPPRSTCLILQLAYHGTCSSQISANKIVRNILLRRWLG